MDIGQRDSSLRIEIHAAVRGAIKDLVLPYKLNEPLHYTGLDGDDYRSTATWQGNQLVIRSIELERGKRIRSEDDWSLAENGSKLVSQKREDGEEEHSTCTSTYEKSGGATAESAGNGPVKIRLEKDRIAIDIGGQSFGYLYMGQEARKPYLYPLRTASWLPL